jgi:uncharacterized protein YacL
MGQKILHSLQRLNNPRERLNTKDMKDIIQSVFVGLLIASMIAFPILAMLNIWDFFDSPIGGKLIITDLILGACFFVVAKAIGEID